MEGDLEAAKRALAQKENKEAIVQRMQNIHEVRKKLACRLSWTVLTPAQRLLAKADAAWVHDNIAGECNGSCLVVVRIASSLCALAEQNRSRKCRSKCCATLSMKR